MSLSNSNNTGTVPADDAPDPIPGNAYAIKMTLDEVLRKRTEGDPQENGFVNEDRLTALEITSLEDHDSAHPAGSSLSAYFLTELASPATIEAFVRAGRIGGGSYANGNYIDSWNTDQYFYLMVPPTSGGEHSFVITIGMSDGRFMSDTTRVTLY